MIESVVTAKGAYNVDEVYEVDSDFGKECVKLGYAVKVGVREATAKAPAKRKATKKRAKKR